MNKIYTVTVEATPTQTYIKEYKTRAGALKAARQFATMTEEVRVTTADGESIFTPFDARHILSQTPGTRLYNERQSAAKAKKVITPETIKEEIETSEFMVKVYSNNATEAHFEDDTTTEYHNNKLSERYAAAALALSKIARLDTAEEAEEDTLYLIHCADCGQYSQSEEEETICPKCESMDVTATLCRSDEIFAINGCGAE